MEEPKKRQHYVFQGYLKAWSNSNQLFLFDKSESKIRKVDPKSILFKKFFYEIKPISENAKIFLDKLFDILKTHPLNKIQISETIELTQKTIISSLEYSSNNANKINDQSLKKSIIDSKNLIEDFYQKYEQIGAKLLQNLKNGDCDFCYKRGDELKDFLLFLSIQHMRTLKKRICTIKMVEQICKKILIQPQLNKDDIEVVAFYIQLIFSNLLATYFKPESTQIAIIRNNSSLPFFTSDQPIFSLEKNDSQNDDWTYFYPISPTVAITVNKRKVVTNFENDHYKDIIMEIDDINRIKNLNEQIVKNAFRFVISNNEKYLKDYVNWQK